MHPPTKPDRPARPRRQLNPDDYEPVLLVVVHKNAGPTIRQWFKKQLVTWPFPPPKR